MIIKNFIALLLSLVLLLSCFSLNTSALLTETDDIALVNLTELEDMISSLSSKIDECRQKWISTQREDARFELLKLYSGYLASDMNSGKSSNVAYTLRSLNDVYTDAISNLDAYLNGTKSSAECTQYSTGEINISGDDIYASKDDSTVSVPTYFVGFGHGQQSVNDMISFKTLGFNCIQIEVGPEHIILPRDKANRDGLQDDDMFSIDTSYITDFILPTLEKAAECDVAVSVLLSPHIFPEFLYDLYPDLRNDNSGFQKYNIYHPVAMRAIEVFIDAVVSIIKDCPALLELCLMNRTSKNGQ